MSYASMKQVREISWDEFHTQTKQLAPLIRDHINYLDECQAQWKGIIAVSRGGLVPAAILAQELDLRFVETVCVAQYASALPCEPDQLSVIKEVCSLVGNGCGWLIVDDIIDSGNTMKVLHQAFPAACTCAPYIKEKACILADFSIELVEQDEWLQFPWEVR